MACEILPSQPYDITSQHITTHYMTGNDTETITQFFPHCPSFHTPRQTLLNNIRNINGQTLSRRRSVNSNVTIW